MLSQKLQLKRLNYAESFIHRGGEGQPRGWEVFRKGVERWKTRVGEKGRKVYRGDGDEVCN